MSIKNRLDRGISPMGMKEVFPEIQRGTQTRMTSLTLERLLGTPIYTVIHEQAFALIEQLAEISGIYCTDLQ